MTDITLEKVMYGGVFLSGHPSMQPRSKLDLLAQITSFSEVVSTIRKQLEEELPCMEAIRRRWRNQNQDSKDIPNVAFLHLQPFGGRYGFGPETAWGICPCGEQLDIWMDCQLCLTAFFMNKAADIYPTALECEVPQHMSDLEIRIYCDECLQGQFWFPKYKKLSFHDDYEDIWELISPYQQ